jgi:hypothetical protein
MGSHTGARFSWCAVAASSGLLVKPVKICVRFSISIACRRLGAFSPVTEDLALFDVGAAIVHVQVTAADVRCGDLDQCVRRSFDLGVGDLVDRHDLRTVVHECTHDKDLSIHGIVLLP